MQNRPWTPDHRDAVLRRVTAVTVGTAVIGAAGAFGLGFGMVSAAQAVDKQAPAAGTTTVAAAATTKATPTAKATAAAKKAAAAKKTASTVTSSKLAPAATKAFNPPPAAPAPAPAAPKAAATSGGS